MRVVLTQAIEASIAPGITYWPLGLGYLASYSVQVLNGVEFHFRQGAEEILASEPDMIGISASTEGFPQAVEMADELRGAFSGPLILGGPHISALPASLPTVFDAGVIGEGEITINELIQAYLQEGDRWKERLPAIDGICFHHDGAFRCSRPRQAIADLDSIPFPDRRMLLEGWTGASEDPHVFSALTSRGCPYHCRFCFSSIFWKRLRKHSAAYVVEELSMLREEHRATSVSFMDDLFVSDKQRLRDISEMVREAGLAEELSFCCTARSNEIDGPTCEMLSEMNVSEVILGLESGSDEVLRLMGKRCTVADNEAALKMLAHHGIGAAASFIVGFPGETAEDLEMTALFISSHKGVDMDDVEIFPAIAYPGTWLWKKAVKEGKVTLTDSGPRFTVTESIFDPDGYILLDDVVKKETFLRYYYQLKCEAYRCRLARQGEALERMR